MQAPGCEYVGLMNASSCWTLLAPACEACYYAEEPLSKKEKEKKNFNFTLSHLFLNLLALSNEQLLPRVKGIEVRVFVSFRKTTHILVHVRSISSRLHPAETWDCRQPRCESLTSL